MKKIKFHMVYIFCLQFTLILLVSCHTGEKSTKAFSFPFNEITIDEIHRGYDSGRYTVKEIVSQYINRINNIDQAGPEINSVIIVNPDAVKIADSLDQIQKRGKNKGLLFGIPVLLKDNCLLYTSPSPRDS